MKQAVKEIVGKRIKGVVVKSKDKNSFGVNSGELDAVRNYLSERHISFEFINEDIAD
jgi:hypothetical protein